MAANPLKLASPAHNTRIGEYESIERKEVNDFPQLVGLSAEAD